MKLLRVVFAGSCALACLCAQTTPPPARQSSSPGRRNDPLTVPSGQVTLRGILLDAGCQDRESVNLRSPAETLAAEAPAQPSNAAKDNPPVQGPVATQGITVDAATLQAERAPALVSRVPDLFIRQSDPTCAITGSTTSFALLMDTGRLVDLDEGGNTLAMEAVQSIAAGRAMLNGHGPGIKPPVTVQGQLRGDRLIAKDLQAGN